MPSAARDLQEQSKARFHIFLSWQRSYVVQLKHLSWHAISFLLHVPIFHPSISSSIPQIRLFPQAACTFQCKLNLFSQKPQSLFFSSPFHACYLQQWWRLTCFFEWRLLVPAQLFSDEADFSHFGEVLGRKQYPVVKFMQGARQQGGERKMSPCHAFSKSPCNPLAKSCDNRNNAAVCTKMPEARPQCQLCTLCLQ